MGIQPINTSSSVSSNQELFPAEILADLKAVFKTYSDALKQASSPAEKEKLEEQFVAACKDLKSQFERAFDTWSGPASQLDQILQNVINNPDLAGVGDDLENHVSTVVDIIDRIKP